MEPTQPVVVPANQHNFEVKLDAKILPVDMKTALVRARIFAVAAVAATGAAVFAHSWLIATPYIVLGALTVSSVAAVVLTITAIYKYDQVCRNISARNQAAQELIQHFNPSEAQKHFDNKLISQSEFDSLLYKDVSTLSPERYRDQIAKYIGFVFTNDVIKAFAQNKWEVYFESDAALEESLSDIVSYADQFQVQPEQMDRLTRNFIEKQVNRFDKNTHDAYLMLRIRCPGPEALQMIVDIAKDKHNHFPLEWDLKDAFARMSIKNQKDYASDKNLIGVTEEFLAGKALVGYQQLTMDAILSDNDTRADFFEKVVKFDWIHAFTEKSLEWLSKQNDLLAACFAFPEFFETKILTRDTVLPIGQKLSEIIDTHLQFQETTKFFETCAAKAFEVNLLDRNSPSLQQLAITYLSSHLDLLWNSPTTTVNLAIECLPEHIKRHLMDTKTAIAEEVRQAALAKTQWDERLQQILGRLSEEKNLPHLTREFERLSRILQTSETSLAAAQRSAANLESTVKDMRTLSKEIRLELPIKRLELSVLDRLLEVASVKKKSLQGEIDSLAAKSPALTAEIERLTPAPTPREIEIQRARQDSEPLRRGALARNARIGEIKNALVFHEQHPGKAQGAAMAWDMLRGGAPEQLRQELTRLEAVNARLKQLEGIIGDAPLFTPESPELVQKREEHRQLQDALHNLNRQKKAVEAEIKRAENDHRALKPIVDHLATEERTLPYRLPEAEAKLAIAKNDLSAAQTDFTSVRVKFNDVQSRLSVAKENFEKAAQNWREGYRIAMDDINKTFTARRNELIINFNRGLITV